MSEVLTLRHGRPLLETAAWTLFLALFAFTPPARAADFTEADFAGDYAFDALGPLGDTSVFAATNGGEMQVIGAFTADGRGGITGRRVLIRPVFVAGEARSHERLEQEITGTYTVEPDGTGVVLLDVTPLPFWLIGSGDEIRLEDRESLEIALSDGGSRVELVHSVAGERFNIPTGISIGKWSAVLAGQALIQSRADTAAEVALLRAEVETLSGRVESLTEQLASLAELSATLAAQGCELLRLAHTPEGRRATDDERIVESCGTAFEWSGEGTVARGRRADP